MFLGVLPPFGYDIDSEGHYYIINPAEAPFVREIFKHYAQGKSYDYIVDHLTGALGKRGRPIGKNSLYSILTNERDMYPLYWTPSKEGIFMRYTYEYKLKCVEMYRHGHMGKGASKNER